MSNIKELKVGDFVEISRTVSEADIVLFGAVSGDLNPAHFNEEYAKNTIFKGRIAHGMISAGYISAVIGMHLPGPGTIYLSQNLKFLKPVRIGDTITARVEVVDINIEKNRVGLKTECLNANEQVVVTGDALVMPPMI
ncbi:MaoC family dehydratase [Treponema phagedenis]|uniref:MaoC family dehydratase n=1 Tax=Treponema phagedenis TaxID=162 RepID=A0AAE6IXP2_TREPH|nr:MaoC family dehydratase [Treponema phagedenis]NVP23957.1 MaoC family dehydratase [Treponema phagedenis]QEJ95309.1 MaoC family dehydratase [Treponema phagedenis]QEJ99492.1 MaoC family dehydratase [Treponema phagedenis]QEK05063.1 MaoC family dehydratase [Treponema phagedenis]QEK10684.1 MaoC family dehydratase [Treponema phagedenis]